MSVDVRADQVAQPNAGADQRRNPPPEGAALRLDKIRRSPSQGLALADGGADLKGQFPTQKGLAEKGIRKVQRAVAGNNVKSIIQNENRAAQHGPGLGGQGIQVVPGKKGRQQGIHSFHGTFSFSLCCAHKVFLFYYTPSPFPNQEKTGIVPIRKRKGA